MMQDIFGQNTTLTTAAARDSWNKTQLAFLAHGAATPTHLGATLEAEPHFALGHIAKAMFYILLGRKELLATATEAYEAAEAANRVQPISQREMFFLEALREWMKGQPKAALQYFEAALTQNPTDILALKLDHAIRFVMGDAKGMRRMIEKAMPAYDNSHPGYGYLLGCHAFAMEETGDYKLAQITGRKALLVAPDDAWGLHAVAHVHDMTADAEGGIKWLTGREDAWAHCNNFRYHVWWHKALMHLDMGEQDIVLDIYDQQVRSEKTDDYRDISNATSLLSRLELDGVDVGNRWDELADISANRTDDGCLIFADLHYLMALVGGKRDDAITAMMGRLHRDAKESRTDMQKAMASPGLATAAGLEAFGEAKYETAFINLAQANANLEQAGGSHAQRDVFERLTIDSGIRAGFLDEAEAILARRTAQRKGRIDGYAAVRQKLIADGRGAAGNTAHVVA